MLQYKRDTLVELINRTTNRYPRTGPVKVSDLYRRFYLKVCNGTWIRVRKEEVLTYLAPFHRDEVYYGVQGEHEKNVGNVLYITPGGVYSNTPTEA